MAAEVLAGLRRCEKTFEREEYREEIEALADPYRVEEAFRLLSEKLEPDEDCLKMELCQLYAAEIQWEEYRKRGIPEEIFWDTMGAFPRFLRETKVYRGEWAVDRTWWSWRQISMTIFRLGALEYELIRKDGTIHIHIPSDADFSPASVDDSLLRLKRFCREYFPEFGGADVTCHSWLLSDVLPELLPPEANIVSFQRRFRMKEQERDSDGCVRFLFHALSDVPVSDLAEDTSLQRKAKALMLRGGHVGSGFGVLKAYPEEE